MLNRNKTRITIQVLFIIISISGPSIPLPLRTSTECI